MGKRLIVKILYNAFIFCIIAVLASDPSYGLAVINVELTSVKQKIEGFGGSGAFYESWLSAHPQKQEIYNTIFGGLGTSIYRIRNSYETTGQVDMQNQAEAIQAAEESLGHPVKIMISSWTPPLYLKSTGISNGGTLARQYYPDGPYKYGKFADWWANSLVAYKQMGITATYISIQNEPSLSVNYPSCRFSASETVDWAGHSIALDAVYQQLSTMQEPPKILAPDTVNTSNAGFYIDAILNKATVYGYAHHLYGHMGVGNTHAERFDNPDSFIPEMQTFRNKYGYKPIFQTEFCRLVTSDGFREAINTARHIHNSLVEENVASYMVWGMFWPKDIGQNGLGLVLIDNPMDTTNPNPGYTIKDTYYAFMHYSKFIQPGYSRINISDPKVSGLRASAFKSPDENTIVLVIINPEPESKEFSVSGLDAYSLCQVFRTDSSPNNNCTNITNNWDGNLPGESITTLVIKSSCDHPQFADVLPSYWAEAAIYKIYNAGITQGCSKIPLKYCPENTVTRTQMAVFLGRAKHGSSFTPPSAIGYFSDVSVSYWAADWIEQFYNDGITTGCSTSPLLYCPGNNVTRAQMAVFLLRVKHGSSYTPPAATGIFSDVPVSYWAADWIEQLYNEGITTGCGTGPLRYCPENSVTRAQMAVFMMRTFGL
jgi:O-glycosyl hydrolase